MTVSIDPMNDSSHSINVTDPEYITGVDAPVQKILAIKNQITAVSNMRAESGQINKSTLQLWAAQLEEAASELIP